MDAQLRLATLEWGQRGPHVLLIHGIDFLSAQLVARGYEEMAKVGYRVTAPDQRGHGNSPRGDDYLLASYATDVLAVGREGSPPPSRLTPPVREVNGGSRGKGGVMFAQVIQGRATDADGLRKQWERWDQDIKPKAQGYLGGTAGVTLRRRVHRYRPLRERRSGAVQQQQRRPKQVVGRDIPVPIRPHVSRLHRGRPHPQRRLG